MTDPEPRFDTKVTRSEKMIGLVSTLLVAASIASIIAVNYAGRANLADAERASCQRNVADRLGSIQVRELQAVAARGIASDPFQSAKTRAVRLREARALQASVVDLRTRVDPKNGGKLDCAEAFPNPSVF